MAGSILKNFKSLIKKTRNRGNHRFYLTLTVLLCSTWVRAQQPVDTLRLSATEVEALFLQNNLQLLAAKLDVDVAEAQVIQAKLWPNPRFSVGEVNAWSGHGAEDLGKLVGHWGNHTQVAMEVEQLIITAGKRKKLIAMEEVGVSISEQHFVEVLRGLQLEIRTRMAEMQYTQRRIDVYHQMLAQVQKLLRGYQRQVQQGNISQSEYLRLKASELKLIKSIDEIRKENREAQRRVKLMMGADTHHAILIKEGWAILPVAGIRAIDDLTLKNWVQDNHAELAAMRLVTKQSEQRLAYERAQRTPDLELAVSYDRGGSIMRDFVGLGVAMDLPFFNRNQGNIKAAQLAASQQRLLETNFEKEVIAEAVGVWKELLASIGRKEYLGDVYEHEMDELMQGYHTNYMQRNISLLQYMDFIEAYLETKDTLLETAKEIRMNYDGLRYYVGSELP